MKKDNKAYKNLDFLNSPEARVIRLLAEYLEPLKRFREQKIQNTIVFFGSARFPSREEALLQKQEALDALHQHGKKPQSKSLIEAVQHAEKMLLNSRYYEEATELSYLLSKWSMELNGKRRFVICSGGGPGIMEAANKGAQQAGYKSIGLNISLPFEQSGNRFISPDLSFEFHYFFMRKFWFAYPSKAMVVFPGGFGTMDEMMEMLTLVQTQKLRKKVNMVLYGSEFWNKILNFQAMVEERVISKDDLNLFRICNTPKEAFAYLKNELTEQYLQ